MDIKTILIVIVVIGILGFVLKKCGGCCGMKGNCSTKDKEEPKK